MFRSYRGKFIAFGLAILFIIFAFLSFEGWESFQSLKQVHSDDYKQATTQNDQAIEKEFKTCTSTNPIGYIRLFRCVIDSAKSDQDTKTSQYDLKAQQEMSEWAYALVLLTIGGILVSIIGLGLLLIDIQIGRNIGRIQSRAYIGLTEISCWHDKSKNELIINGRFKNTGQTPAKNIRILSMVINEPGDYKEEWLEKGTFKKASNLQTEGTQPFERKISHSEKPEVYTTEDVSKIISGEDNLWYAGVFKYEDVFGVTQTTNFRFILIIEDGVGTIDNAYGFSACDEGNEST